MLRDNIRVNSISPGSIRTPMLERSAGNFAPGVPHRRSLPTLGRGASAGTHRDAGRSGGAGGVPGLGQSSILHRRRLPGGRRPAGRHRGAVISSTHHIATSLRRADRRRCGEGAVWHAAHSAVYWTDINRFLIHRFTLADQCVRTWFFDEPVTALTLTDRDEVLAVVLGSGVILWEPASDLRHQPIYSLEGWPVVRLNDARADPRGSLWVGSMRNNVNPDGSSGEVGREGRHSSSRRSGRWRDHTPARRWHLQHAGVEPRSAPFLFWRYAGERHLGLRLRSRHRHDRE